MAYLLAIAAGVLVVVGMVLNARLARHMGTIQGTFVNFVTGSVSAFALAATIGFFRSPGASGAFASSIGGSPWVLAGGLLGVVVVVLQNRVIPKLPVFASTALLFVGQIGAGLALDFARTGSFDWRCFVGALLVCAGIIVNAFAEGKPSARSA
jgi:transporter family-2 protein